MAGFQDDLPVRWQQLQHQYFPYRRGGSDGDRNCNGVFFAIDTYSTGV
jgi:hypothetical protein